MASLALAFDVLAKDRASKTFRDVGDAADRAGRKGEGFGSKMGKGLLLTGGLLAGVGVAAVAGFSSFITEARESQKVGALTAQVIKTTGGAAKVTADQVGVLAAAISNKTGIDDEAIQAASNLLLTFTNVRNEVGKGNDVFSQATQIATDMGAALGGDPKTAAIQLGKALNDPVKGITALTRVGVSFTAQQKDQIAALTKSGDTLGAQKIILAELNKEFGGAAAASATAGEKFSTTFGNFKETIGTALLPALDTALTSVTGFLGDVTKAFQSGGFSGAFAVVGEKISAALPGIKAKLGEWAVAFWAWIQPMIPPLLVKLGELLAQLGGWITGTALPWLGAKLVEWGKAFVAWIAPMIPPALAALAAAGQRIFNWLIDTGLPQLLTNLKKWAEAFVAWIGPMIPPALLELGKLLGKMVLWIVTQGVPKLVGGLLKLAWELVKWILPMAPKALSALGGLFGKLVGWVISTGSPMLRAKMLELGGKAITALKDGLADKWGTVVTWLSGVPGKIGGALTGAGTWLYDKGRAVIQGLINGVGSMVGNLASAVGNAIKKGITDLLPGSPVKKGPLRVLNNGYAGGQIVKMLAGGIDMAGPLAIGALDFAAPTVRANAVRGSLGSSTGGAPAGGIELSARSIDALAAAISRVQVQSYLDGKNVTAAVDARLVPR